MKIRFENYEEMKQFFIEFSVKLTEKKNEELVLCAHLSKKFVIIEEDDLAEKHFWHNLKMMAEAELQKRDYKFEVIELDIPSLIAEISQEGIEHDVMDLSEWSTEELLEGIQEAIKSCEWCACCHFQKELDRRAKVRLKTKNSGESCIIKITPQHLISWHIHTR